MTRVDDAVDGRTARRDRNRELVLDAVIELFAEDQLAPKPADVAARSGVSLRSVYRYFEDLDALVRAAMARHAERIAPLLVAERPGEGTLADRIERHTAARLRLYDAAAPTLRAARVRAPAQPLLGERLDWGRAELRKQTEAMFAPELDTRAGEDRRAVAATVDLLTQFEGIEYLRVGAGYSAAHTADIVRRNLTALLATPR
jgi:AcrR family transcriptional regulator